MSRQSTYALHAHVSRAWLYIFAGFAASLASIGLARFAYAPLVPALIQAHWFSSSSVVFLSAANLTGYLIGALVGQPLARRFSNTPVLRAMMVLVTLAFLACGYPLSLSWFFTWRLLSGIAGGAIMVLVAATVLPHVALARRGVAGGAIFLGVGVGIAGSGTVVPWLLGMGLANGHAALALATVIIGTFPPGIVPLALARIHRLIPHDALAQNLAWSRATVSFATFQALAGYAYSAVFSASGGHHRTMFLIATLALVGAVLAELGVVETAIGRVISSRLQRVA